ncbi:tetratricopeptide repeat protein [Streptomyces sp. NPDC051020]|uniref:AfsR/SARP family transcriptional regulator n=1 Tax=Streptomyces sp. NPDC051020 TaxID=3155409 RepID=UPI00343D7E40
MRFRLLGPLEVEVDGRPVMICSAMHRALLSVLLLRANRPVTHGTLQAALWGENPPATAAASLKNHISRLRRILESGAEERVRTVPSGYLLRVEEGELDADEFMALMGGAQEARASQDWSQVSQVTSAALRLWRGNPMDCTPVDAVHLEVRHLMEAHQEVLGWHFDAALRLGIHDGLAARLAAAVAEHPLVETFSLQLMQVLHRGGRSAQALEVYQRLRRTLVDELGIEPSAAVQQTQRRILADQDVSAAETVAGATRDPGDREGASPATSELAAAPRAGSRSSDAADDPRSRRPTAPSQDPASGARPSHSHLPKNASCFTGRDDEFDRLLSTALSPVGSGGARIFTIDGMPGVGKSAFAVHAAHRLADHFPDGQLFLAMNGHAPNTQPMTVADALHALLTQLGVPAEQIPPESAARAAHWHGLVADRRLLVLLDDVVSSEYVRPLLPEPGESLVLLTSRRRLLALDDVSPITLDVLSPEAAARLFVAKAARPGLINSEPGVREVVRLCGGLPLAVNLMAARLRHYPAWRTSDLVDDLVVANRQLPALTAEDVSVAAAFELSYRMLAPEQRMMFRLLGLSPVDVVDRHVVAALGGIDPTYAWRMLRDLEEQHLVEEPVRGRYRMHDLIREHARSLAAADEPEVREAALDRLLDYYVDAATKADRQLSTMADRQSSTISTGIALPGTVVDGTPVVWAAPEPAGEDEARAWLAAELGNARSAVEFAMSHGRPRHAVDLAAALQETMRTTGHLKEAEQLGHAAVARAGEIGDAHRSARALVQLGVAQRYSDRYLSAEESFDAALGLFESLTDIHGKAAVLSQRGTLRRLSGQYEAGAEDLSQAGALFRELGDQQGQAAVLVCQAHIDQVCGRFGAAEQALRSALAMFRAGGNRLGVANVFAQLGDIQQLTGDYPAAAASLQEAQGLYRELDNRIGEVNILSDLGVVLGRIGRFPEAETTLRTASELCRAIGERLTLAYSLTCLAGVQSTRGRLDEAWANLRQALALCRHMGNRMGQAYVLAGLGAVHRLGGRHRIAASHLHHALAVFEELQDPVGVIEARNGLGALAAAASDFAGAETHYALALKMARAVDAPLHEAQALEGLGLAYWHQDRPGAGEAELAQALEIVRQLGTVGAERLAAVLEQARERVSSQWRAAPTTG